MGGEGSRTGQREKLIFDGVPKKASVKPPESSEAGMAPHNCFKMGRGNRP